MTVILTHARTVERVKIMLVSIIVIVPLDMLVITAS